MSEWTAIGAHLQILQHLPAGGDSRRGRHTHTVRQTDHKASTKRSATGEWPCCTCHFGHVSLALSLPPWTPPARSRHGKQACYEARQASSPAPRPHPDGRQVCHRDADSARKGRRQGEESAALGLELSHSQHNQHTRLLTHTERTPHYTCIVPVDCCADPVGPATEEARCTAQRTRQALGTEALLLFMAARISYDLLTKVCARDPVD